MTAASSSGTAAGMIGQVLAGRYAITRLLGRGGMGVVYLARELEREGDLVIKMISPALRDDAQAIARFEREARRLQGLDHPNIVRFHGFERAGDLSYLVMEYVDGVLLTDALERKGRYRFEEFVPIAAQILKGIGHAHSRDVLLRDIKPSNIMLCERQGRANFVKLLDFGLAKVREGDEAITTAHVLGTAGYIAPEVLRGAPLDLRVDVYALGVLFYLMLSGRLPFDGEPAAIFTKTLGETPPPLARLVDQGSPIPPGFIDLVERCLAKQPNDRPGDANAIVEEMIDVVPAPLFRLPRVAGAASDITSDRFAASGLYPATQAGFLHGSSRPESGRITSVTNSTDRHVREGTGPVSSREPTTDVQLQGAAPAPASTRARGWGRAAVLLGCTVTAAIAAALYVQSGGTEATESVASRESAIVAAREDASTSEATDTPDGAQIAARLRDAERASLVGDTAGAIEAYLDVLEMAPEHALAQSGLEHVRALAKTRAASPAAERPGAGASTAPTHEVVPAASVETSSTKSYARRRTQRPSPPPVTKPAPSKPATAKAPNPPYEPRILLDSPKKPRTSALLPLE